MAQEARPEAWHGVEPELHGPPAVAHREVREKVLTKPIKTKVKTQIAEITASRLEISTSTMRRLQQREGWHSEVLENVLNGKYW